MLDAARAADLTTVPPICATLRARLLERVKVEERAGPQR
jgi:hypothetical protein